MSNAFCNNKQLDVHIHILIFLIKLGTCVIDWLESSSSVRNRQEGLLLASALLNEGHLQPAGDVSKNAAEGLAETTFLDATDALYYFVSIYITIQLL